jgi:hypothetical protein
VENDAADGNPQKTRIPTAACKTLLGFAHFPQARRRRSLTTKHFSTAAIHLRKADFLSEGWGVPHYEPNGVIKNDIEYILMQRKPGGYRTPSQSARILSVIPASHHKEWFQQIWSGLTGASTRNHPAPYPVELAERLIRMFSFAGDTVLDPFMGTGSTNIAASRWGRNSVGIEIDPEYFQMSLRRVQDAVPRLLSSCAIRVNGETPA